MNPKPDVHAYVLGELGDAERRAAEQYLAANPDAAAEAERLSALTFALKRLPEEEPPHRIAFVSDKVFEPAWWQRSWRVLAAAGMLSVAVLSHAMLTRPQPAAVTPAVAAGPSSLEIERMVETRVNSAMERVVATVKAEQKVESARLVAAAVRDAERKFALERQNDRVAVEEAMMVLRKQVNNYYVAVNRGGLQ